MNIEARVRKIMAKILEIEEDEIEQESSIGDFASWDSLRHLEIIAELESQFNIQFTPEVLMEMEDFSDIVKAVEDRVTQ